MQGLRTGIASILIFGLAACSEPAASTAPPTSVAPSVTSAAPSPSTAAPRTITILGSGDVLLHPDLWTQAQRDAGGHGYNFGPLFAQVKPLIESSDLAICHMETAVGGTLHGYPTFSVPAQVVPTLHDVGYDSCSTASNHSLDQGQAGIDRTLAAFDKAGLKHTGTARTEGEQRSLDLLDVRGAKVAQLSYTFGFNGLSRPAGHQWMANLIDAATILADAHRAKTAGAAIVVVSLHWGTEYSHTPNAMQVSLAKKLMASPDIDLILGCHAHVVQPMTKVNGKWVVYGMGNEVAHHAEPINDNREGILTRFTFTETTPGHWVATSGEAIPIWMQLGPDRLTLPKSGSVIYNRIMAHVNAQA